MKESISIIGAGSWGTTLAINLARKKVRVKLYGVFHQHNLKMSRDRENKVFLPGVNFPPYLSVEPSLDNLLKEDIILIAIPVKYVRKILKKIAFCRADFKKKVFLSVSKGIEIKTLKRVSEIINEELGVKKLAVLSGPTIAKEVAKGIPTAAVIASKDRRVGERLQKIFNSSNFRVYLHDDLVGVELSGALKNVIALSCGISDGLGFGTNTKSALITRGLVEMMRIGKELGAKPKTFWGISGLGDLATTCFSLHSRNRMVGEYIGRGQKLKDILAKMEMVAEGIDTVKSVYAISKKLKVDMPIAQEVYRVLYKNKTPHKAVEDLMRRSLKSEGIS